MLAYKNETSSRLSVTTIEGFPVIHLNKYICLREPQLTNDDIVNFYQCYNELEISRFLPNSVIPKNHYDAQDSIKRYRSNFINNNGCFWFIVDKRYNRMIGTVGLQSYDTYNSRTEICYEVSKRYTRLGIATCATIYALDYAMTKTNLNRVEAMVVTSNTPSISLLLNVGFEYEGLLKQYRMFKGEYVDINVLGYTRDRYYSADIRNRTEQIIDYYNSKCIKLCQERLDLLR